MTYNQLAQSISEMTADERNKEVLLAHPDDETNTNIYGNIEMDSCPDGFLLYAQTYDFIQQEAQKQRQTVAQARDSVNWNALNSQWK